jgi:hypothetical protein
LSGDVFSRKWLIERNEVGGRDLEKAAAASHPSEGDFPLRYWRLFIGAGLKELS